jgi:hypothetical protein
MSKESPFEADSGTVTMLSINLNGGSSLRKQIYGHFKKE